MTKKQLIKEYNELIDNMKLEEITFNNISRLENYATTAGVLLMEIRNKHQKDADKILKAKEGRQKLSRVKTGNSQKNSYSG